MPAPYMNQPWMLEVVDGRFLVGSELMATSGLMLGSGLVEVDPQR